MKKLFFWSAVCLLGACFASCDSGCTCELKMDGQVYETWELNSDDECDAVDGIESSAGGYTARWECN